MSVLLGVCPCFDDVTQFSKAWYERLFEKLSVSAFHLKGEKAVRSEFNHSIVEHNPSMIVFYDHGGSNALIDNDRKNLLDEGNINTVKGREVYTMCCETADKLGATAYRKGCRAWWGYTAPFSFVTTDEEVFSRLANMGLILHLNMGVGWTDAVDEVKKAYDEEIERQEDGNPWTIISLVNDRNCLVVWTAESPPPTDCAFRMLGIKLFGGAGQRITRTAGLALTLFLISYGVAIHDFAHQVYELRGTCISLEGGYLGFGGMLLAFLIGAKEYLDWLSSK